MLRLFFIQLNRICVLLGMSNVLARTQRSVGQEGWGTGTVGWYMHTYVEKCSDWRPSVQCDALVLYRWSKDISLSSAPRKCVLSSRCEEISSNGVREQPVNAKAYFPLYLNLGALCKLNEGVFHVYNYPEYSITSLQSSCNQTFQPSHGEPTMFIAETESALFG